jgi:hypothetical protein
MLVFIGSQVDVLKGDPFRQRTHDCHDAGSSENRSSALVVVRWW